MSSPQTRAMIEDYKTVLAAGDTKAAKSKFRELLDGDQLLNASMHKSVLSNFEEADITFLPTYKFAKKTGKYKEHSDCAPSWTDRILWSHSKMNSLNCNFYTSLDKCRVGDYGYHPEHSPVVGNWTVEVKKINKDRRKTVIEEFEKADYSNYEYGIGQDGPQGELETIQESRE